MKELQSSGRMTMAVVLGLVMVGCIKPSPAGHEKQIVLRVTRVLGRARTSTDGKNWRTIKKGDVFIPGDTLQTADDGTLDIRVDARALSAKPVPKTKSVDPAFRIRQSSVLRFAEADLHPPPDSPSQRAQANVNLELDAGRLEANIDTNSICDCRIKIPPAIEVSGAGHFSVYVSGTVSVLSGSVKMTNLPRKYQDVVVTSGHKFVFGEGVVALSRGEE